MSHLYRAEFYEEYQLNDKQLVDLIYNVSSAFSSFIDTGEFNEETEPYKTDVEEILHRLYFTQDHVGFKCIRIDTDSIPYIKVMSPDNKQDSKHGQFVEILKYCLEKTHSDLTLGIKVAFFNNDHDVGIYEAIAVCVNREHYYQISLNAWVADRVLDGLCKY